VRFHTAATLVGRADLLISLASFGALLVAGLLICAALTWTTHRAARQRTQGEIIMRPLGAPSERAARGAAFLDVHEPGWALKMKLATFDMGSDDDCVFGQLYGLFGRGLGMWADELSDGGQDPYGAVRFGLMFLSQDARLCWEDIQALNAAWATLITGRMESAVR
jgi:hypothetical protein